MDVKVTVNGESIREFRLLIESLWTRIDERSRQGFMWLSEEKTRSRRLRLLKPYNLRFHMTDDGYAVADPSEVPAGLESAAQDAIANCPEQAISETD